MYVSRIGIAVAALAVMVVLFAGVMGCQSSPEPVDNEVIIRLAQTRYPADAEASDLDIVVTRQGELLVLANRTASSYRGVMVWLNQQYVWGPVDIPVASKYQLELRGFINEHGESYPVGGPLTPDKSMLLTLAELYATSAGVGADDSSADGGGVRYRLLVRQDEAVGRR